jgi:rare lipoprotein A
VNRNALSASTALGIALVFAACVVHAADDAQKAAPPATPAAASSTTATPPAPAAPAVALASAASGETGLAAVYNHRLNGHKTSSGQRYDANQLTAAHKTLPFGTKLKVTNVKNHKSVIVTINDRGPTQQGRILDISTAAAKQLGIRPTGMAEVSTEVVAK